MSKAKSTTKPVTMDGADRVVKPKNNKEVTKKPKKGKEKICLVCNKKFTPSHGSIKTCSDKCRDKRYKMMIEEEKRKREANKKFLVCSIPGCGVKFNPNSSSQKYCSPECASRGLVFAIQRQTQRREQAKLLKAAEGQQLSSAVGGSDTNAANVPADNPTN